MLAPLPSARASDSSWFTVCVARTLARPICLSDCFSSSALAPSRCARSACMRSPASGVLSWCAASARKRFCVPIESFEPAQQVVDRQHQRHHLQRHRRFVERAQVVGLRSRMRCLHLRQRLDAAHQREPDQQHRQRQDRELRQQHALDDLGGEHRLLLARLGHLQQRRRRVRRGAALTQSEATRTGLPCISSSRRCTSPGAGGSSSWRQRQVAFAAEQLAARRPAPGSTRGRRRRRAGSRAPAAAGRTAPRPGLHGRPAAPASARCIRARGRRARWRCPAPPAR